MTGAERPLADYPVTRPAPLRWNDFDTYGHLNNAVQYEVMDTEINGWLADAVGADIRELDAMGVVVETGCRYLAEVPFGDRLRVGVGVAKVGRSSVAYDVGFFVGDEEVAPAAVGRFVHVYIDQQSRRPVPVPDVVRRAVESIVLSSATEPS